ncbi:hypothetical protein B0H16DRAFT_1550225 [Mycena metata]|uniref:GATA-type domain-containing protein n=1 Tax=Mycena metata TaxID=1033252 RepID=A0AAD7IVJ8_9AGAR|nr:hypothetical protein B0H16DRAFT_1550225 [Mycena metata]
MKRKGSAAERTRRARKRERPAHTTAPNHDETLGSESDGSVFVDGGTQSDGSTVLASRAIRRGRRRAHPPPGTEDLTEVCPPATRRAFRPRFVHFLTTQCANCEARRNDGWHRSKFLDGSICSACLRYERERGVLRPPELEKTRLIRVPAKGDPVVKCTRCGNKHSSQGWNASKVTGLKVCWRCYQRDAGRGRVRGTRSFVNPPRQIDADASTSHPRLDFYIMIPSPSRAPVVVPARQVNAHASTSRRTLGSSPSRAPAFPATPQVNAQASTSRRTLDSAPSRAPAFPVTRQVNVQAGPRRQALESPNVPSLARVAAAPSAPASRVPGQRRVRARESAPVIAATLDPDLIQAVRATSSRTRCLRSTAPSPSRAGTPAFHAYIPRQDEESDDELNFL